MALSQGAYYSQLHQAESGNIGKGPVCQSVCLPGHGLVSGSLLFPTPPGGIGEYRKGSSQSVCRPGHGLVSAYCSPLHQVESGNIGKGPVCQSVYPAVYPSLSIPPWWLAGFHAHACKIAFSSLPNLSNCGQFLAIHRDYAIPNFCAVRLCCRCCNSCRRHSRSHSHCCHKLFVQTMNNDFWYDIIDVSDIRTDQISLSFNMVTLQL